ncbi:hypothetical protein M409DRAFT_53920 [Zasmidium cellare ATCC 36951]|uniref:Uncharacterized protein n=1 Tax=Zasmidium cellare ATCC 36951 TaxID=1080233 RepID=A0A6A6CLH4_ZASCE|nr:uncharacterized protein M409DRAFT_53920 [Zasmidium cellare ATCC 36951]KAF2167985.1 hypothetical protein M409DRAFT_53920 [Zasmidium cellare ATCC 36951]
MASALLLSSLLLLSSTSAQSTSNDTYTYLDVTFSDPGARDCGQGTTGEGNAVTLSVTSPGALFTCFNVNETFSQPNITYNTRGYSCLSDEPCGLNYTITGAEHFNAAVNYSQIWYRQNSFPVVQDDDDDDANPEDRVGRLRFQTYNGLDCLQVGGEDDDGEVEAWYAWNCNNANGTCGTVPYDVKSFAIVPVEEDDQGDDDCYVAAEYANAGARSRVGGSLVALLVAFVIAATFL